MAVHKIEVDIVIETLELHVTCTVEADSEDDARRLAEKYINEMGLEEANNLPDFSVKKLELKNKNFWECGTKESKWAGLTREFLVTAHKLHDRSDLAWAHNYCNKMLERLRSGSRRRTYGALRGELRELRDDIVRRL